MRCFCVIGMSWLIGLVTVLGGCAGVGSQRPAGADRAPQLSQQQIRALSRLPDPTVRALPRSETGNPSQYEVWGKTYYVAATAEGYQEDGVASWYGAKFHGRRTSSGEIFNQYQLSAAHRSLPIPVFARVTNLTNGRSTIVKINDRGPFHEDRIIDLSYAAAVKLGFHEQGTARVRVEALTQTAGDQPVPLLAHAPEPESPKAESTETQSRYYHAGSFATAAEAETARLQLASLEALVPEVVVASSGEYVLRFGPVNSAAKSERLRALLLTLDIGLPKLVLGR
jgi:rare lipoprotein A